MAAVAPAVDLGPYVPLTEQGTVRLSLGGIRFAHFCASYIRHTKGRWAGEPLFLEPWQIAFYSEMLKTEPGTWFDIEPEDLLDPWGLFADAIERPDYDLITGRRPYREAYIQTAEKTGKSTGAAALQLYFLGWDGEAGSEVYAAATTSDQARIVFDQARKFVEKSPALTSALQVYKDVIHHPDTDSVFRVLSSESAHDEGLNPHAVVIDELWAHRDRALYDTLTSRIYSGTRADPMACLITNAGADTESICFEVYSQAKSVLEGDEQARDDLMVFIPEIPEGRVDETDDASPHFIDLPDYWKLANPQSWVDQAMLEKASKRQPPYVFRRRRLNAWVTGENSWLPVGAWDDCRDDDAFEQFINGAAPGDLTLYLGVDIGQKRDTSAVTCVTILPDGRLACWSIVWQLWADKSQPPPKAHVVIESGEKVPVGLVGQKPRELAQGGFYVAEIGYDPYKFEDQAEGLDAEGFDMIEWPQTDTRMVPACEALFELVTDGQIVHNGDPVLAYHVANGVAVEASQARGWRLHKGKARLPTDALIALVIASALARARRAEGTPTVERLA